jgi:hypothetical protein
MLALPFLGAAILSRQFRWPEIAALLAAWAAFTSKDPLAAVARHAIVWKKPLAEAAAPLRTASGKLVLLTLCAAALLYAGPRVPWLILFAASGAFAVYAISVQMRNRQRAPWFQVLSAVALTSSSLAAALAATGSIPNWCWPLWLLSALQASAGVFIVHARLDAMIASRKKQPPPASSRRASWIAQGSLAVAAVVSASLHLLWIAAALTLAAIAYSLELLRQRNPESLNTPLRRIGLQALTLACIYSALVVAGLWNYPAG